VVVDEITTERDRDEFIRFQIDHYAKDAEFVPPIVAERRDFMDKKLNPFFAHAEAAFFVARRQGRPVGRIAAAVDARYNQFHRQSDGMVGLFESQNEPGIAAALFEKALAWLKARGMRRAIGPVNLAFHHDCGLLVEGFEHPVSMMMAYNPRYYPWLFEANGFVRIKDMYTYSLFTSQGLPEKVVRLAERVKQAGQVRVRRLDTVNPENDIRRIKAIYETMLRPGFGLAPMSEAELTSIVQRLRPVILLRPELSLIAEADGDAVAFSITLPDTNAALKAAGGYLFPFGLAKLLWAARSIDRLRVLLFGIKDGWRRRGIDALLALETFKQADALGYVAGALGWVVEDDKLMNRTIQATGAQRLHTHRLYERPVVG
jgi:GNAT superfamily N-acetyltransferase